MNYFRVKFNLNQKIMKKTLTLVSLLGMFAFTACGPSAAELEAKLQH
jgi:hypothetical protein